MLNQLALRQGFEADGQLNVLRAATLASGYKTLAKCRELKALYSCQCALRKAEATD